MNLKQAGQLSVWKFIIFMLSCMTGFIIKAFGMEYSCSEISWVYFTRISHEYSKYIISFCFWSGSVQFVNVITALIVCHLETVVALLLCWPVSQTRSWNVTNVRYSQHGHFVVHNFSSLELRICSCTLHPRKYLQKVVLVSKCSLSKVVQDCRSLKYWCWWEIDPLNWQIKEELKWVGWPNGIVWPTCRVYVVSMPPIMTEVCWALTLSHRN